MNVDFPSLSIRSQCWELLELTTNYEEQVVMKKIVNSSEFQTLKMDEICIENEC